MRRLSADRARRLSLAAQGFHRPRPEGRVDRRHLRRAMDDMQVLQIDSVNVCVRSHYMPLFSRLGAYDRGLIDTLAYGDKAYFEYWGHEASFIPVERYPALAHRREELGHWKVMAKLAEDHPGYIDAVEAEVRERGPLAVGDLEDAGQRRSSWWGWGHGKLALEYLFAKGRLNVSHRTNFTRYYTTPEQVLPPSVLDAEPLGREDGIDDLTMSAMRGLGVATEADIAQYWRMKRADVRPALHRLAGTGAIEPVMVDGWRDQGWLLPGMPIPRRIEARALLTPFDPVVWAPRDRSERIHGFDYTIEIYVPEEQRVFGYYVYPFLLGDRIVGRVDLKSDRSTGRLIARATWVEDHADPAVVAPELAAELHDMAAWLHMDEVEVAPRGTLADAVRKVI